MHHRLGVQLIILFLDFYQNHLSPRYTLPSKKKYRCDQKNDHIRFRADQIIPNSPESALPLIMIMAEQSQIPANTNKLNLHSQNFFLIRPLEPIPDNNIPNQRKQGHNAKIKLLASKIPQNMLLDPRKYRKRCNLIKITNQEPSNVIHPLVIPNLPI